MDKKPERVLFSGDCTLHKTYLLILYFIFAESSVFLSMPWFAVHMILFIFTDNVFTESIVHYWMFSFFAFVTQAHL